ncbi:SRPBCC domain-containing protein [Amycolatopsis nivea]
MRPDLSDRPFETAVVHDTDAPPDVVFRAWATGFDEWFAEPGAIWMRPEAGVPYFFETFHMGARHPHYGRILAYEADRLLEMTWLNEAGTHGVETVLRVEIAPRGDGSRLRLTHAGFRDEKTSAEHGEAWEFLLRDRLDPLLARSHKGEQMTTSVRQQEYEMLFDAFDLDHDGQIGQLDLDVLVQRWCVALQVPPGHPAWNQITRKANRLWQDLIGHFDKDGDKRVSKQEWVDSHEQPGFVEKAAAPWAIGVFDIGDPDGEGRVSLQRWMTCQTVTGWDQAESLKMFQQLDDDQDGYVQRDKFVAYIEEFYSTTENRWWSQQQA